MKKVFDQIEFFCNDSSHGSSKYGKSRVYVKGKNKLQYAPLSFFTKKNTLYSSSPRSSKNRLYHGLLLHGSKLIFSLMV